MTQIPLIFIFYEASKQINKLSFVIWHGKLMQPIRSRDHKGLVLCVGWWKL